jgi:hypothetical protein
MDQQWLKKDHRKSHRIRRIFKVEDLPPYLLTTQMQGHRHSHSQTCRTGLMAGSKRTHLNKVGTNM